MGDLTRDEQAALNQLEKVCDSHQKRTTDILQKCALLKQNQQLQLRLDIEEAVRQKKDAIHDAVLRLQTQRTQAVSFVSQQINALQTTGILINGALWKATTDYDLILTTRAGKQLFDDIILNLAIEMLPHLKLVGLAMKGFELVGARGTRGMRGWKAMADLADFLERPGRSYVPLPHSRASPPRVPTAAAVSAALLSGGFPQPVKSFGEFLDARSNDILSAIRNPIKSNKDLDSATTERFKAYKAKNSILTDVLGDLHAKLVMAGFMESLLHKYIFWYDGDDVLVKVQEAIKVARLDSIPYAGDVSAFETLADVILYDMLRSYTKSNFVVRGVRGETVHSSFDDDLSFDGLDEAQRDMIYARCGQHKWYNLGRSAVKDWRDLVVFWGARFEPTLARIPSFGALGPTQ